MTQNNSDAIVIEVESPWNIIWWIYQLSHLVDFGNFPFDTYSEITRDSGLEITTGLAFGSTI